MQRLWASDTPYAGTDPVGPGTNPGIGTWTCSSDGAGRMVSASGKGPDDDGPGFENQTLSYRYDGAGNRTRLEVTQDSETRAHDYALDLQGLPLSVNGPGTAEDLFFDHSLRGFLTAVSGLSRDASFTYDPWGRLTSAQEGAASISYGIDALGRTIARQEAGSGTFTYEGLSETLVQESLTQGGSTQESTWANLPSGPWFQQQGGQRRTAIRDLHGDLIGFAASDGQSLEGAFWYSPFGEQAEIEAATPVLGYQGQLTDPETGLVDMTTRQYAPSLGRFTTPDVLFGDVSDLRSGLQHQGPAYGP